MLQMEKANKQTNATCSWLLSLDSVYFVSHSAWLFLEAPRLRVLRRPEDPVMERAYDARSGCTCVMRRVFGLPVMCPKSTTLSSRQQSSPRRNTAMWKKTMRSGNLHQYSPIFTHAPVLLPCCPVETLHHCFALAGHQLLGCACEWDCPPPMDTTRGGCLQPSTHCSQHIEINTLRSKCPIPSCFGVQSC